MRSPNVERNNVVRKIDAVRDAGGTIFCVIFAQLVHCELLNQLQNLATEKMRWISSQVTHVTRRQRSAKLCGVESRHCQLLSAGLLRAMVITRKRLRGKFISGHVILSNDSSNLCDCRDKIARQVEGKIADCNSALTECCFKLLTLFLFD